jgi:hypothetical protein
VVWTRYDHIRSLIGGGHLHNSVRVDLERDLNLRHAARRSGNPGELKLAKKAVVLRERTLALENLDKDGWLIVRSGRETETIVRLREIRHEL